MTDAVFVALITASGIVIGTLLTSLIGLLQSGATRRTEERKVIYDIASKLAVEQWKLDVERTDAANKIIAEKGIWNVPTGIDSFRIPIPHIAHTVQRIIAEIDSSTRPKSRWSRLQDWWKARRAAKAEAKKSKPAKKKEEAEQDVHGNPH
jgi:hypothetical protein